MMNRKTIEEPLVKTIPTFTHGEFTENLLVKYVKHALHIFCETNREWEPAMVVDMKNRLRVLRAERGWSQQELAERLGVSRQTINSIETERYDPSLQLALKLAKVFKMPVETIFEDKE